MAAVADTVYARDRDVHLAYQIVGDGGPDLLFVPTATFPIDLRARHGRISRHPYRGYRLLMVMESVGGTRVKNGGIHL
jgi:hypothetical protein